MAHTKYGWFLQQKEQNKFLNCRQNHKSLKRKFHLVHRLWPIIPSAKSQAQVKAFGIEGPSYPMLHVGKASCGGRRCQLPLPTVKKIPRAGQNQFINELK